MKTRRADAATLAKSSKSGISRNTRLLPFKLAIEFNLMLTPICELRHGLRIGLIDMYVSGGGVLWCVIEDTFGSSAVVCLDGRQDSPFRGRLFDGARHPNKPQAKLIELGAIEEGTIVSLISSWLDSDVGRKEFTEYGLELARDVLIRVGDGE